MAQIPTTRGNPQASEIAVQDALPLVGSSSREDGQTVLDTVDADIARLYEDKNWILHGGGIITFTGTQVQFSENLYLELSSDTTGSSPVIINLTTTTRSLPSDGTLFYVVIDRSTGTVSSSSAGGTSFPKVEAANKEAVLICKRRDDPSGLKRLYWRNGMAMDAGQSLRLGAAGGETSYARIFLNM